MNVTKEGACDLLHVSGGVYDRFGAKHVLGENIIVGCGDGALVLVGVEDLLGGVAFGASLRGNLRRHSQKNGEIGRASLAVNGQEPVHGSAEGLIGQG